MARARTQAGPKGDLQLPSGRESEGVSARPGPILGLAIMPEARPDVVHRRRLPAAADPQRLAVIIRHRPGIARDAGIGARRVDLGQIREPTTEPDHYAAVMALWPHRK